MTKLEAEVRQMQGAAALPRENGELVFEAPWQGRVFGLAVGVVEHLGVSWEEFRRRLIAAIADDPDRPYYESWATALEQLVADVGLVQPDELTARARAVVP